MNALIVARLLPWVKLAWMLVLAGPCCSLVYAQPLRDPTVPPLTGGSAVPGAVPAVPSIQPGGMAVLVRGGVPYLVVGTRLYAKGQKVGQARIERITETEVWLREAGVQRRLPVFGGIQRQASRPVPIVPSRSSSTPTVAQSQP